MNDNVVYMYIITSKLAIILFKYSLLHSTKEKQFSFPMNSKLVMVVTDQIIFPVDGVLISIRISFVLYLHVQKKVVW